MVTLLLKKKTSVRASPPTVQSLYKWLSSFPGALITQRVFHSLGLYRRPARTVVTFGTLGSSVSGWREKVETEAIVGLWGNDHRGCSQ